MLEVRLIGTFDIHCDGKPVIISSRAAQSLFAFLILNSKTVHRREKLAGIFWPDATEEKARAYLRHELWLLRKMLTSKTKNDYLIADDIGILFNASVEYWLDVDALRTVSDDISTDDLMKALTVFQGELLPGFYEDWVGVEREHLQVGYEQKISQLLELLEIEKRWTDILEWAERWVSIGQKPEAAYRYLMTAHDALGDRAKVVSTYERCKQALHELDLEPSEQTRALAFKRTSSLNIPIPLTSFIGRENELKEVADLLSKSRLVTLTGSGGVGKTRLAIQVIADILDSFPDGIWFLDLAPLGDPTLVPNTLANVLGLRESGELPITELLINYFDSRTSLVILDNCEHLIESCSQLVNSLLTSCEHLSILATSREVLRVSGEIPYRVPSLELPVPDTKSTSDDLKHLESIRLFGERARVVWPEFAIDPQNALVVAQICQRLDGIPLAIELAAARANMLTVEQISKRLDDRFSLLTGGLRSALPRHQTLRATIDWSYNLLSEEERLLFRRLAFFAGGWTLEAAEEVCNGRGIESSEILVLLSQLVDKSMILVNSQNNGETRYRRLETIRQYAREQLIESGEEKNSRTRHMKYFLQLSEQAELALRGPAQIEWMARLIDERDNIRAALAWADKTDVEGGLYISGRLERLWESFDIREGNYWLSTFLQKPESHDYPRARARALHTHIPVLSYLSQVDESQLAARECQELYRALGDQRGEADILPIEVEEIYSVSQRMEVFQSALRLAQASGDIWWQARMLFRLGWNSSGDERLAYWARAITLFRQAGDWYSLAKLLSSAGNFALLNGNLELAQNYLDEASLLNNQLKDKQAKAMLLHTRALIALRQGNYNQAHSDLQEELDITEEIGARMHSLWCRTHLGYLALCEGNLTKAQGVFAKTASIFFNDRNEIGVVFNLEGVAGVYVATGKPAIAARLIGWADITRQKIGDTRPRLEQADVDKIIVLCLAKMGEVAFSDAYEDGKKMSLDEAVAYALEDI